MNYMHLMFKSHIDMPIYSFTKHQFSSVHLFAQNHFKHMVHEDKK